MALCPELVELLAGFEKRMKFINIVRALLEYKYPDEIRAMIPDKRILDNIILAALVYIKERTLGEEQTCTVQDIQYFLEEFSVVLPPEYNIDAKTLAKHIIVNVLQNGGILTEYLTFDSTTETFKQMPIRLLNEEKGSYHLTDDAFDFLFRSKEIESELDYSVTRFRMREYIKRDNYKEALDASRELISRIRGMKISMDDFLIRCRENISQITVDQYDTVICKIRSLLESEYEELSEIKKSALERKQNLEKAGQSGLTGEEIQKRRRALQEIIRNISLTIEEQRILINKKTSLSESYQQLIQDQFMIDRYERLNFKKDILIPLMKNDHALENAAQFLLFPLTVPQFPRQFSIESLYAPQSKLSEEKEIPGIDLTEEEEDYVQPSVVRNQRHLNIIQEFFRFAISHKVFQIQDFIKSLTIAQLDEYCQENTLPNVLLSLFAMQELNIAAWNKSEHFVDTPDGEFELSWCLENIPKELVNIQQIYFTKTEGSFRFRINLDSKEYQIEMSSFTVEVIS